MFKPSLQYISNTKGIRIPKPTNLLLTLCLEIYAVKKDSRSLLMRSLLSTTMILKFKYNFFQTLNLHAPLFVFLKFSPGLMSQW